MEGDLQANCSLQNYMLKDLLPKKGQNSAIYSCGVCASLETLDDPFNTSEW